MIVKLLTEHHLEFLSLKGGCRGSSWSTLVKMSNFWKSHAAAQIYYYFYYLHIPGKSTTKVTSRKRTTTTKILAKINQSRSVMTNNKILEKMKNTTQRKDYLDYTGRQVHAMG